MSDKGLARILERTGGRALREGNARLLFLLGLIPSFSEDLVLGQTGTLAIVFFFLEQS